MRRRLSLVIAFIGVLGLVGFTPAAQAGHSGGTKPPSGPHEHSPSPPALPLPADGECVVIGTVDIGDENGTGGVAVDVKNHNHFRFGSAQIDCIATPTGMGANYAGTYEVEAAGGTDGQGECDDVPGKDTQCHTTNHGEQLSQGWSHSACYDDDNEEKAPGGCQFDGAKKDIRDIYDGTNENPEGSGQCTNCNEITVEREPDENGDVKASKSTDNWLKFCRGVYDDTDDGLPNETCSNADNLAVGDKPVASLGGGNVIAWGALVDWTENGAPNPDKAGEVLCFIAQLELTPSGNTNPNTAEVKITGAVLEGEAEVWVRGSKEDCRGKKKPKPA